MMSSLRRNLQQQHVEYMLAIAESEAGRAGLGGPAESGQVFAAAS